MPGSVPQRKGRFWPSFIMRGSPMGHSEVRLRGCLPVSPADQQGDKGREVVNISGWLILIKPEKDGEKGRSRKQMCDKRLQYITGLWCFLYTVVEPLFHCIIQTNYYMSFSIDTEKLNENSAIKLAYSRT